MLSRLEKTIGYSFKNEGLLVQALTHPSYLGEHKVQSNQRMEFLGDAVLELAVSTFLYNNCVHRDEGELSRIRAAIVSEKPLFAVAEGIELGKYLLLSQGEATSGGNHKPSILSDALEAVFGAIYLDSDFETAQGVVLALLKERMQDIITNYSAAVDYKSRLQELLQKNGAVKIEYVLVSSSGPAHDMHYVFAVCLNGKELGRGEGKTKKQAQQEAACRALERM